MGQIAIGCMELHAVKPNVIGCLGRTAKSGDGLLYFGQGHGSRRASCFFAKYTTLIGPPHRDGIDVVVDTRGRQWGVGLITAVRSHSTAVPKLQGNGATGQMDRRDQTAPSLDLLGSENPRRAVPGVRAQCHVGGFGDDQTSRCALHIVLRHHGGGDTIDSGARAGEGRHPNSILELKLPQLHGCKQILHVHESPE